MGNKKLEFFDLTKMCFFK